MTQHSIGSEPETRPELELVATLFDLGREISSVLDVDALLQKLPHLIARLIKFQALAVYLLDARKNELRIGYSVGYPEDVVRTLRLKVGKGLVGLAVAEERSLLVNDVDLEPRYVEVVPGAAAELVVPLVHKARIIGALNLLGTSRGQFTETDLGILEQFGALVAVALQNARLFEREREYVETLETLAEIGREVAAILDLDQLLTRIAHLAKRVIDYRTFGILLMNEAGELEMKVAIHYGENANVPTVKVGEGLVGYAALHKEPVLVADVLEDPRYLKVVEDVRSEMVIPLLLQDRCLGVFDLESPERDAFTKTHVEILTLLASQAAVAIENARLYETVVADEMRLEKEIRFAQRVQAALLPLELPKRLKGVDVAARFAPARRLGGDFYDYLTPEPNSLVVAVGDVSGKGVPAALYSAFAGELVRGRTFRRRYTPERAYPAAVLTSINTILHQRQLEESYCTLCYAAFDFKGRAVVLANSGLPYPIRCSGNRCAQIELPGVPLGSFAGSTYDEVTFKLSEGDLFVFCTDGVFEAMNEQGQEFTAARLLDVVKRARRLTATEIVDAIFDAVAEFRGDTPPNDDMTALVLRITA